jgi:glycine cleavage system H protein
MTSPKDLRYSKEHEWVKVDGETATIGITDYAQNSLTDIVFIELPKIGKQVAQFANLGVVESVKSVSDIFSPVSGEVIAVNNEIENNPELINKDPYGKGWMAKVKMKDKGDLNKLMTAEQYEKFVSESKH